MNYYSFYPGDYARDTADLSWLEDLAYRRLLDHCYSTESHIPKNKERIYCICKARTPEQRSAVDFVVTRFFEKNCTQYVNKRVASQLQKQQIRIQRARENGLLGGGRK